MNARSILLLCIAVVITVALATSSRRAVGRNTTSTNTSAPAKAEPKVVEDSMHEFMEYVFQPTYRRLKAAMAKEPADNAGWKAIKSDSLILAESCNLLFLRKPDHDQDDWASHAAAARDKGALLYGAARKKDFTSAGTAWKAMLNNCNACHRQFENGKHILTP